MILALAITAAILLAAALAITAAILLAAALARSTANTRAARRDRDEAEAAARAIEADRDTLRERLGDAEEELAHLDRRVLAARRDDGRTRCEAGGAEEAGGEGGEGMSAVDVNARLTDAEREALVCALSSVPLLVSVVEAILRDRLPEATTFTEWGTSEHASTEKPRDCPDEELARQYADLGYPAFRRTVTRYADHYGPWERVPE